MDEFSRSGVGRLMALAIGIALVGGGASALMTQGPEATFVMAASLFVPIVITVLSLPHALAKHFPSALVLGLTLPLGMFLYAVGVGVARASSPSWGYWFVALGLLPLLVAARPSHDARAVGVLRTAPQH